jgi:hypothetical protein
VVARVGDREISRDELMEALGALGVREIVTQWLQQRIAVEKEARRLGVVLPDAEVRAKLEEEKTRVVTNAVQATGKPMTFAEVQSRFGVTLPEMEWRVRLNLLARRTYEKSLESQVPSLAGQRKLAHILIATVPLRPGAQPPTPEDALKKLEGILAEIKSGKITFEKAAAQFSDDKGPDGQGSATRGGAMPYVGKGAFDPAFEKAGWALSKPGDLSAPVKSQFGWHLIKLIRKGEDATPPERAQYKASYIQAQREDQRSFTAWLNGLIRGQELRFNTDFQLQPKRKAAASRRRR